MKYDMEKKWKFVGLLMRSMISNSQKSQPGVLLGF